MNAEKADPQIGQTIRLVGDLLGEIIIDQSGREMFELVEEIRSLSKEWRGGDDSAEEKLNEIMKDLAHDLPKASIIVKAFSTYFRLVNLAEEHQRVNVLNSRENQAYTEQRPMDESIRDAIETVKSEGLDAETIQRVLEQLYIVPVFTAHPTESRRKTIRQILKRISALLRDIQSAGTFEFEKPKLLQRLKSCIVLLWQSDETRNRRPTVMDEVRNTGLYFFEETLFRIVPGIYNELENALGSAFPHREFQVPNFLRYGSWIAGDRDGNPLVTADVTKAALAAHQEITLERYANDVNDLYELLSVSLNRAGCDIDFQQDLETDLSSLDEESRETLDRFSLEPYRQRLILIYRKLQNTRMVNRGEYASELQDQIFENSEQLLAELSAIRNSLIDNEGGELVRGSLDNLIRRVQVFGFHLATLDVRQHSGRHRSAISDVFSSFGILQNYTDESEDEKCRLLTQLISSKRPLTAKLEFDDLTNEVISTFRLISAAQKQYGEMAMQTYIISMTDSVSNILEVLLLMKDADLFGKLDIVPLFETVDDLLRAPQTMQALFANEIYKKHLEMRNDNQHIMIGYSDSNKDGGYLRANWMLFTAQRNLAECCKNEGVQLTLFHGRGGSLGRGGGPANRAILSQPPESVAGRIRVTEQGEVVSSRYSNQGIARRHLQQIVHAAICSTGTRPEYPRLGRWNEIMDDLSKIAHAKYRQLVDHSNFIDYFQTATPVELVEYLNIGSRPSRRKSSKSIDDLRAIPWVFSWTQCRANISSWFGIGTAISQWCGDDTEKLSELQEMFSTWQFFNTLFKNVHVGLGRADMSISKLYAQLAAADCSEIFEIIRTEYELTLGIVLSVTQHKEILDTETWLQRSIRVRNPYVDPLNYLQVALLERYRNDTALDEAELSELRRLLADSVNGIAAGLQNVG